MEIVGELLERMGLSPEYQRKRIITDRYEAMVLYDEAVKALNNRDLETLGRVLPKLRDILPMKIKDNRQEMDCLETLYLRHGEQITNEECISRLQQALAYTVPLERVLHMEEGYLSRGEIECLYNIANQVDGAEKEIYMDLLRKICERLGGEDIMQTRATTYELIMYKVASHLGDMGKYAESNKISDDIMKASLSLRRMNMLHMCIYNNLWNRMKGATKNTSANNETFVKEELQKCFQLSILCKDRLYESFYNKKLNQQY